MIRYFFLTISLLLAASLIGQNSFSINGNVKDQQNQSIPSATIVLKAFKDSSLVKVEMTDENGNFIFRLLPKSSYFIEAYFSGMKTYKSDVIEVKDAETKLPSITLTESSQNLDEIQVTAKRTILEVKSDRTIFNVQGTINSVGENGLNLLRKAPRVTLDNNNNISVMGRSGVLVYVDGKRVPLAGDELSNYLQNLSAEQIDRIEIITSPGAKYEAQGNAGIIDIRLKKDKNLGFNSTLSSTFSQGRYGIGNASGIFNYRQKKYNLFGSLGYRAGKRWNELVFKNYQNSFLLNESNNSISDFQNISEKIGLDYFINAKHTIGFLANFNQNTSDQCNENKTFISNISTADIVDSFLLAPNRSDINRNQSSYNLNYAWKSKERSLSVDLDYGSFDNRGDYNQPNNYYDKNSVLLPSSNLNLYHTKNNIDISSIKLDSEFPSKIGKIGAGLKLSQVNTDNDFLFYNIINQAPIQNNNRSNIFDYTENVYAAYVNYSRALTNKWNLNSGLRAEQTDATGDLTAYKPELEEEPVHFNYLKFFPSVGLSFNYKPEHAFGLNYSRRINRPNYNVLNPFKEQLSELSFIQGNKFLKPEIVNNVELNYTLKYMYSFSLGYSLTTDQITRLIGADPNNPKASFINWDNLATQNLFNANASCPIDITKWWNMYSNLSCSYTDNRADYGTYGKVDIQAFNYIIYQQHTFNLGKKWKAELSGWYSGPGVWGGVFLYEPTHSINVGVQRKFFNDKLNVRLTADDLSYQSGWSGYSDFGGLYGVGYGNYDSRKATISLSYDLGNKSVKSRKRNTGIESESKRVEN